MVIIDKHCVLVLLSISCLSSKTGCKGDVIYECIVCRLNSLVIVIDAISSY